ncbi:hypothetical protein AURANDRAFT_68376 [Aureococcus anophagefferens]|uniref:Uncharacterized protein n=1 Tax=Aureococcus anophagefferens TaxID=44056 RepID=F0YPF2_AURAN|nr:hypothetical protein AURANDRAFT_68376 [Aureococcus anophagefferens]EGB03004.1 hypothetical protein AURANDRAFT_68376 [Aureococcus anophagefferens]|eukprot:XP_009042294.1 hypothetical protein AURANDRAFT_68376 [Aureococcus anophagefferens]
MDLDLAEIIDDGESGAPDYDVDDDYERQYLRVQHDFDKLTTNYRRLQTVNEALKRQIEQQHTQLAEYLKAKNDAERVAHESELRMAKMAKNAEIDARAREGQVKRVRVMEHQMKEVLEESDKERRQRAVAEEKTAELHKALNRERAQRLHDLHQNFRIAGTLSSSYAKWDAMDVSDDEEQRWQPPRDIDVPLNITDDDLATPQFASPEDAAQEAARVKAMSDGDRANWRAAGWLHSRAGDADEAGECARRSAVQRRAEKSRLQTSPARSNRSRFG